MVGHALTLSEDCLARNAWVCWDYVTTRSGDIAEATVEHVYITVVSVVIGVAVAVPLALLARRYARLSTPIQAGTTALYTIPSLALFSLLVPLTGLSVVTVIVGLVMYTLTILVRAILAGLESVPPDVRESATGMGYGPRRLLLSVEVPLALPTVFAGLRVATVSTVALTTVGSIIGYGGLGNLIFSGLRSLFKAEVLTASLLCVALAVAFDLAILGVQRLATPWQRTKVA